jgi:hypothetical protein
MNEEIEEKVKAATDELLLKTNWTANMELCDSISRDGRLGPLVLQALKKRLSSKNPHIGSLSLDVLQALVQNCSKFQPLVANQDFLTFLVKILPQKIRDPKKKSLFGETSFTREDQERFDKLLSLIASWTKLFSRSQSYPIFKVFYQDLVAKGVEFPPQPADPAPQKSKSATSSKTPSSKTTSKTTPSSPEPISPPKIQFHDPECRVAAENANLLIDLLTQSEGDISRDEAILTLVAAVRGTHSKFMSRIQYTLPEHTLSELLKVNDMLLDADNYFQGLVKGTTQRRKKQPPPSRREEKKAEGTPQKISTKPSKALGSLSLPGLSVSETKVKSNHEPDINLDIVSRGTPPSNQKLQATPKKPVKEVKSKKKERESEEEEEDGDDPFLALALRDETEKPPAKPTVQTSKTTVQTKEKSVETLAVQTKDQSIKPKEKTVKPQDEDEEEEEGDDPFLALAMR